jgi:type III restriction enzyme
MNRHVNAISGRLSLRPPQRDSLAILDRLCELLPPKKNSDRPAGLAAIQNEFPTFTEFERDFPSFCFSLATGVGKTRLMGAFISYLYLAHGVKNFFVLAPNLTIYNKLITDFTPNTPKYVFTGISEFAIDRPEIITGDNYEKSASTLKGLYDCKINIFNISKINSEVRGGKSPRIKRLSEYIGQSYFDYLSELDDLVILMDESHRYRASAGIRAINDLQPLMGLELTATPFIETGKSTIPFKNVIFDYPLGKALADGFIKEPAVVTRKDFNPIGMSAKEIERIKLEDGIRLHESLKVEIETYARNHNQPIIKPFVLVIARDTTHAAELVELIGSELFGGRYRDKILQVDSSKTGAKEDETIERLLKVESTEEPTEIVVHVNMLKEGWDVTNLYTLIPLRAANARTLVEQTIGRGLRLPYGKRTGEPAVDRLNIIAHDKFQEIVDDSKRPDSQIQLQQIILVPESLQEKSAPMIVPPTLMSKLGIHSPSSTTSTATFLNSPTAVFTTPETQKVAQITYEVIHKLETQPDQVPTSAYLATPAGQALVQEQVAQALQAITSNQLELAGINEPMAATQINAIIAQTTELVIQETIDIPRITITPIGEVRSGFHPFTLSLENLNYGVPEDDLWIQTLREQDIQLLKTSNLTHQEKRLEDYIIMSLVDFNDVSYDEQADLLYNLAGQIVQHLRSYLTDDADIRKILQVHHRSISALIHTQMQPPFWETAALKPPCYAVNPELVYDFRQSPQVKSNMAKYLFGGFDRCLYPYQQFQSDAERVLSIIDKAFSMMLGF